MSDSTTRPDPTSAPTSLRGPDAGAAAGELADLTDLADRRFVGDLLPAAADGDLEALHGRLASDADARGLLDVAYRTLDSPVGQLLLAATPQGVVRVAYVQEGLDTVLAALAARVSPRILLAPRRLDAVARQLEEYFARKRRTVNLPLDLRLARGFRSEVLQHLRAIPYGATASYTQVAAAAGHPRAVRAVGTACARNPLPVVIPCHRVLRSDGTLGGYAGGLAAKRTLLSLEAADPGPTPTTGTP